MTTPVATLHGTATPALPHPALPDAPPVASGWPDFDDLHLIAPGRVTLLDVGCAAASDLARGLLAGAVAAGRDAAVVDGGNWLDAYRLGEAARRAGLPRRVALESVRVARAFTAYQLQTLVEDRLPAAVDASPGAVGLVMAASLPELYLDVDLAPAEARVLAARALASLRDLARRAHVPVVVTNATVAPDARHPLRRVLDDGVDETAELHPAAGGGLLVRAPRKGAAVLAPAPGARQRRLTAYAPDDVSVASAGLAGDFASHLPDVHLARLVRRMRRPSRAGEERWRRREGREVVPLGTH